MATFDIRVLGFDDAPGQDPVADLSRVFGIDTDMARQVVARAPVLVKRGVDEARAEQLFHLLRDIGAQVRIEPSAARRETTRPPMSIPAPGPDGDPLGLRPMAPLPVPNFDAVGVNPEARGSAFPRAMAPVGDARSARPPDDGLGRPAPGSMRPAPGSVRPGTPGSMAPPAGDQFHCPRCNVTFAEHQVRAGSNIPQRVGMNRVFVCPRCQQAVHAVSGRRSEPLIGQLVGAFAYPFQKSAPVVFISVALVASLFGLVPFIGAIFMAAVLAAFYFSVIKQSAAGNDALPSTEQAADLYDVFGALFRFYAAVIVPFVPAFLLFLYMPATAAKMPVIATTVLAGLIYMPASVMVAVLSPSCLGPLNPVAGVLIMTRVPGSYALTAFGVVAALGIDSLIYAGLSAVVGQIPLLGWFLLNLAGLPLPTVASRMLGIFLHHHEAELGLG